MRRLIKIVVGTFGVFIALGVIGNLISPSEDTEPPARKAVEHEMKPTPDPKSVEENKPFEPVSPWSYSVDEDKMGRKRSFGFVKSTNTLNFKFPYVGEQRATLIVRKTSSGTDVMLTIEKGQFLCGITECSVSVRFDKGTIQQFSASGPTDHSTTTLFLGNTGRFISLLRKAKTVLIESTFYQEGNQTLEFNVEGFKWP